MSKKIFFNLSLQSSRVKWTSIIHLSKRSFSNENKNVVARFPVSPIDFAAFKEKQALFRNNFEKRTAVFSLNPRWNEKFALNWAKSREIPGIERVVPPCYLGSRYTLFVFLNESYAKTAKELVPDKLTSFPIFAPLEAKSIDPREKVTPWFKIPYEKQIEQKTEAAKELITSLIQVQSLGLRSFTNIHPIQEETIRSPKENGYRNKIDFTIGLDEYELPMVGFVSLSKGATHIVSDPSKCLSVSETALAIRNMFQNTLHKSKFMPYEKFQQCGVWRCLTVRSFNSGQNSIIVEIFPDHLNKQQLDEIRNEIKETISEIEMRGIPIHSAYIQHHSGPTVARSGNSKLEHIYGSEKVYEVVGDLKYYLSPNSFFQPNSYTNVLMHSKIRQYIMDMKIPKKDLTIVDVCCGVGSISLNVADLCNEVIGIESSFEQVDDAQLNAKENKIDNARFFAGKAEFVVQKILSTIDKKQKVIVIADPPRAGLLKEVHFAVEDAKNVDSVIFLSCANLGLVNSGNLFFQGFLPKTYVCVDTTPHTDSKEVIIHFIRKTQ